MSLFRDFSEEESNAILKAIKIKLGLSSTITHLGHAAMFLATLKRSPRQSEELQGGPFISPCFMNGRRYLRGDNNMANCYIPLCQAVGVIVFPDVKHYITLINGTNPDPTKALIRAVTAARTSYQSIRHQNSILSESLPIPEFLASTTSK